MRIFGGGILNFWPYLVELHEKKCRTIPKISNHTLKLESMFVYKFVVTFNGFSYIEFDQTLDILQKMKLLFSFELMVSNLSNSCSRLVFP